MVAIATSELKGLSLARIEVSDLGKIAAADLEIAPLTILVGKNNTGKTYIANAIWAICNIGMSNGSARRGRKPVWLSQIIKPVIGPERRTVSLGPDECKRFLATGIKEFNAKLPTFLSRVFAYEGFENTKIGIVPDAYLPIEVSTAPDAEQFAEKGQESMVAATIKYGDLEFNTSAYPAFFFNDFATFVSDRIYYDVLGVIAFGPAWLRLRYPTYIPAARTGLMLALSSLVDEALQYSKEDQGDTLPLPLTDFLRRMQRSAARGRGVGSLSRDTILDRLVDGQITSKRGPVREYQYKPRGVDLNLPLHAVSSMVTELAPLVIDMRSGAGSGHVIFEEPEAHLHLEAQREIARVIARLIKDGTYVTLTTHSDTFLQQINNLMSLHAHPRKAQLMERFGYDESDLIDPESVKAFEFCPSNGGTQVRTVKKTAEGFVVPTLNSTLLALAKETIELRSGVDA